MVIDYVKSLVDGLAGVFSMFRVFFASLPMAIQALMYFGFGGILFISLLYMLFRRG